ncbi:MAG: TetR/AcrR family transcriptional regulator [Oscillospiraceae bacterium]|nr:TetR/AcrR family transcriptional regulator [Oscillospiraceae bacterium]
MKREENNLMKTAILDAVISCKKEAMGREVSRSEIASRAGISERTLSRYYPDKDLMVYEAAVRYLRSRYEAVAGQYRAVDTSGMNGLERLLLLAQIRIQNYEKDTESAQMFVRAYITALNTAVYHRLPSAGFDAPAREIVLSCIREGVRDGSIRGDVVPVDAYLMLSSNFNGLVFRLIYMCSIEFSPEEHKKELLLVFRQYLEMLKGYLEPQNGKR